MPTPTATATELEFGPPITWEKPLAPFYPMKVKRDGRLFLITFEDKLMSAVAFLSERNATNHLHGLDVHARHEDARQPDTGREYLLSKIFREREASELTIFPPHDSTGTCQVCGAPLHFHASQMLKRCADEYLRVTFGTEEEPQ